MLKLGLESVDFRAGNNGRFVQTLIFDLDLTYVWSGMAKLEWIWTNMSIYMLERERDRESGFISLIINK